jgi:hypothetical protein
MKLIRVFLVVFGMEIDFSEKTHIRIKVMLMEKESNLEHCSNAWAANRDSFKSRKLYIEIVVFVHYLKKAAKCHDTDTGRYSESHPRPSIRRDDRALRLVKHRQHRRIDQASS